MNCSENNMGCTPCNLVYLNKIFYDNESVSCPITYALTTSSETFSQTLNIGGSNCGTLYGTCPSCNCGGFNGQNNALGCGCDNNCCNCSNGCNCFVFCGGNSCSSATVETNSTFTITNSCVTVNTISVSDLAALTASDVTVDGFPVTSLTLSGNTYTADLSGIMSEISNCPCEPVDMHLCNPCQTSNYCNNCPPACDNGGHFFLTEVAGPWEVTLSIVIEGYMTTGSQTCPFKLCFNSLTSTTGTTPIAIDGANNFALNCVTIPCTTNGNSPSLVFDFSGCAVLLNPAITVSGGTGTTPDITLELSATLVLTPSLSLNVVRSSLFNINATEIMSCCDNLGQCDACSPYLLANDNCQCNQATMPYANPCNSTCIQEADNCSTFDNCNQSNMPADNTGTNFACQCCDTNGYRF